MSKQNTTDDIYTKEREKTDELPIIGTVEIPGSHFNYLRRGKRALQEPGK